MQGTLLSFSLSFFCFGLKVEAKRKRRRQKNKIEGNGFFLEKKIKRKKK